MHFLLVYDYDGITEYYLSFTFLNLVAQQKHDFVLLNNASISFDGFSDDLLIMVVGIWRESRSCHMNCHLSL